MNQTDAPAGSISGLDDSIIGDSSQYRMKKDELGLNEPEEEPYKEILDNTGLNMKPDSAVNDGMVVMTNDRQQVDPNAPFDPSENEVEYTDQTDEQGNLIPDLRFDQTQNSDEDDKIDEINVNYYAHYYNDKMCDDMKMCKKIYKQRTTIFRFNPRRKYWINESSG